MIRRDPKAAARESYDLIIIGGGIHGVAIALESAARRLRPLLLEQADFGSGVSAHTLRIVHGGLRYLQSLDLKRFRRSVEQRRWWLRTFPDLVRPFPCLMPLDRQGLRHPLVFRTALFVNDLLSWDRNRGVPQHRRLPGGAVLDATETMALFPGARRESLAGAALWYDASMDSPPRLIMEMLRWTVAGGGTALNYVSARNIRRTGTRLTGVVGFDELTGEHLEFQAPVVVNAAGPWCRGLGAHLDRDRPELFLPSMAFNVLLDTELPASVAVAVSPPGRGTSTYFLRPKGSMTFAGTFHVPWKEEWGFEPRPDDEQIARFVADLNAAVPELHTRVDDVVRVFPGLLPATDIGAVETERRSRIVDHGTTGGPSGLVSVSGVKFTTAPAVARRVLDRAFPSRRGDDRAWLETVRPEIRRWPHAPSVFVGSSDGGEDAEGQVQEIVREEAVIFLEDLLARRLDWVLEPFEWEAMKEIVGDYLPDLPADPVTFRRPGWTPPCEPASPDG